MFRFTTFFVVLNILFSYPILAATDALSTIAEHSGFQKTGRYDEVIQLCAAYQKAYPKQVRCTEFGRTPEGRPMMALIATRTGAFTAAEATKRNIPVLLVQDQAQPKCVQFWQPVQHCLKRACRDR